HTVTSPFVNTPHSAIALGISGEGRGGHGSMAYNFSKSRGLSPDGGSWSSHRDRPEADKPGLKD
ncbi:MAG TPA: hypothetical protein PKY50_07150, partial [Candidatus Competibacter sp.]|nr:hypothetical protein [Candidatus Competibacter sp.]